MCSFTPSPAMSRPEITPELAKAFDELRIAAALHMGWDPKDTEMTICRPHPTQMVADDEYDFENDDDCEFCGEWNRCTCFDDDDDQPPEATVDMMSMDELDQAEEFFYAQHTY